MRSLSLHSGWHASDDYLNVVVEQWRTLATALPSIADVVIQGIFPWCFTPEMYVGRPEFVDTLVDFVRGRPAQPVDAFLAQIDGVVSHDASAVLGEIDVPTLITFGAHDLVCSTRFAPPQAQGTAVTLRITGNRIGQMTLPMLGGLAASASGAAGIMVCIGLAIMATGWAVFASQRQR